MPSLQSPDPSCPACSQPMDSFGDHTIVCSTENERICRHDALRDAIFDQANSAGLFPKREPRALVPDSQRRPGDVYIPHWRGRPHAFDVAVTSPLCASNLQQVSNSSGAALVKMKKAKIGKQFQYCRRQGITFMPLVVDARQTKSRRRRTPYQTKILMTNILRHLLSFVPRSNVSIVEAPPLNDAPESDIYPYNQASFDVAQQHGVHFARTLIGENHLWRDGYHIQDTHRHLLVKSIAAAAVEIDPNDFFGLKRPPYGHFGPWESPKGVGFFPLAFNKMAVRQPMYFRGPPPIRPLMCIDIPRPR